MAGGQEIQRRALITGLAVVAATQAQAANLQRPPGYPRSYDRLIAAAAREGQLVIYSSTEVRSFSEILRGFKARYPFVNVQYEDLRATQIYDCVSKQITDRKVVVDLLINSAMDHQIKVVNDGYAQAYASPEKPNLHDWAVWKNEAYAISSEPVVFAYNRRVMRSADVPRTHGALQALLERKRDALRGKIGIYDPIASGTGFLYLTQDVEHDRDNWRLLRAIGRSRPKVFSSTRDMIRQVKSGELALAYNMSGSYALMEQRRDPVFGVVIPSDYVLVASRIAAIPRDAPHSAAAKLFLDYLLSHEGEARMARHAMASVRARPNTTGVVFPKGAQPIRVGPQLLANLDQLTKAKFLNRWNRLITA